MKISARLALLAVSLLAALAISSNNDPATEPTPVCTVEADL